MITISTWADLVTYLADTRGDLDAIYIDLIIDKIQASDHPAWGADWSEWLDKHCTDLICEAIGKP